MRKRWLKINVIKIEDEDMAIELFGYEISDQGLNEDIVSAFGAVREASSCKYMACANPHSLVVASHDREFEDALQQPDVLIPDGSGIVLAAKILQNKVLEKVAGSDFFLKTCEVAEAQGNVKFFFLGSTEQVLDLIKARLNREFPNIEVCGTYSPPFSDEFSEDDNRAMVEAVNSASPDFLWVGMTAPKQEKWILANRDALQVPFAAAIGAVFDFYAGTKQRSSDFWIKIGLEWLPRFFKEPKRLWERNLKSTPIFLWWILREKIKQGLVSKSS